MSEIPVVLVGGPMDGWELTAQAHSPEIIVPWQDWDGRIVEELIYRRAPLTAAPIGPTVYRFVGRAAPFKFPAA